MKTIVLVALLAAAGCSKERSDCDVSVSKGMDNVASALKNRVPNPQMQQSMMTMIGKLKGALVQRCSQDKWGPEALSCFATVASRQDIEGCGNKLTEEQRTKLRADVRQATAGPRTAGGMPGHPPMLTGSGSAGGSGAAAADGSGAAAADGSGAAAPRGPAAPAAAGSNAK